VDAPRILVVSTGGTIAALGHGRLDLSDYATTGRSVSVSALLDGIPELERIADVRVVPVLDRPSHEITWPDVLALARAIGDASGDIDGVVVTHGTNTLEETAFGLDLLRPPGLPIVVTGAMRPASALSADGPMNLLDAVRVAASGVASGWGVLVSLNQTILAARDATKTMTDGVAAFRAPGVGPSGRVLADGSVAIDRPPAPWPARGMFEAAPEELPRVDVVASYLGCDGVQVEACVAAGARGIVVAATGAGYLPAVQEAALLAAASAGVRVCIASRTGAGAVVRREVPELIPAGDLNPWKARLLLANALAAGLADADVRDLFAVPGTIAR
jgi:L-asparaginase